MIRGAGAVAVLLTVASVWGLTDRIAGQEKIDEPLRLSDVLSRDPREAPAACANVSYGGAAPAGMAATAPPNQDGTTRADVSLFILAVDQIAPSSNSFGLPFTDIRMRRHPCKESSRAGKSRATGLLCCAGGIAG